MVRSTVSKVMWVGRATVFLVGLAVVLALMFGVAATALAGTGVGATFNLGRTNTVDAISRLVGSTASSMLLVDNNGVGTALDLRVGSATTPAAEKTVAPMKVDSQAKVANLNADELDGRDESAFLPASGKAADSDKLDGKDFSDFGAARVIGAPASAMLGPLPVEGAYTSKGGMLIISASGSGYRNDTTTSGWIGMYVKVDGRIAGFASVYTNETNSHRAFVNDYIVVSGLPAGQHTIRLEAMDGNTSTDSNDHFRVTVLEIPT
jgi:hypothetical protein